MSNAAQLNEENINKIFLNAQKFSDNKMYAEAEKGFQFLLKTLPNNAHILSSYSKHQTNQKNFDIADKYLKQAIKIAPNDIYVLLDLAVFYSNTEDYKGYTQTLEKAFQIAPTNSYVIINYAYYLLVNREYEGLKKFILLCLKQELSLLNSDTLKVALAIVYYINNDFINAEKIIEEVVYYSKDESIPEDDQVPLQRSFRAYYLYMQNLFKWQKDNLEYHPVNSVQKIYIVGDSHSFGAANSGYSDFILQTKLIMDCSAWQLASSGTKLKKIILKNALKEIEKGSKVIFSFGEIDCRVNVGIHRHHIKNPHKNRTESIKALVKEYVSLVAKYAKNRNLDMRLLNCPAPLKSFIHTQIEGEENIENYITIPQLWNEELAKQGVLQNLKILDIYAATHEADGWSKENIHLDNVHFKPNILVDLLNK